MIKKVILFISPFTIGLFVTLSVIEDSFSERLDAFPENYQKKRIIISTDIGGSDKDDTQSMIHYLVYGNMFDLEGIIISRPRGLVTEMNTVLAAYKRDFDNFKFVSDDYLTPRKIRRLIKIGASRMTRGSGDDYIERWRNGYPKTPRVGYSTATQGSRWIVEQARRGDPRPLYIMCWGATTDVAQAIHDAPDIVSKIRVFAGGTVGYNYVFDPAPTNYLRTIKDLRWIDTDSTGRGIYLGGQYSTKKYGNVGFVQQVIRSRGALGRLFYEISAPINVNRYGIKMGDTTQLLFLFNGTFRNPFKPNWGGQYCRAPGERNRFIDCTNKELQFGGYDGAKSIAIHRVDFLKDWERRLEMIYG